MFLNIFIFIIFSLFVCLKDFYRIYRKKNRFGSYRFGNYRYGRYGHQYRRGHKRYEQINSLGYGYKKGSAFYDEGKQDESCY